MKKLAAVLLLVLVLLFVGCGKRDLNYVIQHERHIQGIVTEIFDDSIRLKSQTGEVFDVFLDVQYKDSYTHFSLGDEAAVYYDGTVLETVPMQIRKPYATLLITPASRENEKKP